MRIGVAAVCAFGAACSFHAGGGGGGGGGGDGGAGDGGGGLAIVEGVGAQPFGDGVASGFVDHGALAPDVFVGNGLHARGFATTGVGSATDPFSPQLGTATGEAYGYVPDNKWPQAPDAGKGETAQPVALGIGVGSNWSVAFDGEIFLATGSATIGAATNNDPFVLAIRAGSGGSDLQLAATGTAAGTVVVAADGWYPIALAMSHANNDASLSLFANTAATGVDPVILRARSSAARGAQMSVFFESELELGPGPGLDVGPIDHAPAPPLDYALDKTYSIRYQGQLYADGSGAHAFAVVVSSDPNDRYRLFVDGELVASTWLGAPDAGSGVATLDAGWHAFTLDHAVGSDPTEIHFAMDGAPIASDHLRPTEPQGYAIAFDSGLSAQKPCTWASKAGATTCDLDANSIGSGEVVDYADFAYQVAFSAGSAADTTLALVANGSAIAIPSTPNELEFGTGSTKAYAYVPQIPALAGLTGGATFALSLDDATPNDKGTFQGEVVATTHGGFAAPFAAMWSYTSAPYPIAAGAAIEKVRVSGNAALANAGVVFELATAANDQTIGSAAFAPVPVGQGITLASQGLVVFRVTVTTDGWTFPNIDRIEVDYADTR